MYKRGLRTQAPFFVLCSIGLQQQLECCLAQPSDYPYKAGITTFNGLSCYKTL